MPGTAAPERSRGLPLSKAPEDHLRLSHPHKIFQAYGHKVLSRQQRDQGAQEVAHVTILCNLQSKSTLQINVG